MPWKPARPCAYPGCPKLCGSRYCADHTVAGPQLDRKPERRRPGRKKRGLTYDQRGGYAWVKVSRAYLVAHPWCATCLIGGERVKARAVHHLTPKRAGGSDEWINLQALCSVCHAVETAREMRGRRS